VVCSLLVCVCHQQLLQQSSGNTAALLYTCCFIDAAAFISNTSGPWQHLIKNQIAFICRGLLMLMFDRLVVKLNLLHEICMRSPSEQ